MSGQGSADPGLLGLKFGLPAKARLIKLWLNTRPDLVHVVTEGPLGWSAIAAARKLKLPVTFVGDGPLRGSLQAFRPDAILAGMRTGGDLAAHYASADLFLFASLTETFGNVTSEALASGLGVVAYDCAAAADLITDGGNGRTVPPGDTRAFISTAVALACNQEALRQMRGRSAESVAHLDWELIHDSFARTLDEVAAMHHSLGYRQREFAVLPD